MISPKLRDQIGTGLEAAAKELEVYSPYSYIAGALGLVLLLMMSMYRGAQPR